MHPTLQAWRASRGECMLSFSGKIIGAFDTPLVFEPGIVWAYGASYDWAGLLVTRLTKMRFGAYCEQNIFTPLGMTSTFFSLELRPDLQEKLVVMCTRDGDKLVTGGYGPPNPPQDDLGGVGLYSTVPDSMKLLTDLLQDHPKTLKPEIVDLLFTPQLEEDGVPMQAMKAVGPLLWGFFMTDPEPEVNHRLGSLLCTNDNPVSGTPKGIIRWSVYSGPMWTLNREMGLAWFYATQVLPFGDVETGDGRRTLAGWSSADKQNSPCAAFKGS